MIGHGSPGHPTAAVTATTAASRAQKMIRSQCGSGGRDHVAGWRRRFPVKRRHGHVSTAERGPHTGHMPRAHAGSDGHSRASNLRFARRIVGLVSRTASPPVFQAGSASRDCHATPGCRCCPCGSCIPSATAEVRVAQWHLLTALNGDVNREPVTVINPGDRPRVDTARPFPPDRSTSSAATRPCTRTWPGHGQVG